MTASDEASADARERTHGAAGDPFIYGSRVSVDIRPTWQAPPAPPPIRPHRPWPGPRVSRDQLLGPALVCGFLAAAGIGLWSSGWSPTSRSSAVEVAAMPTPSRAAGHAPVSAPTRTAAPAIGRPPGETATADAPAATPPAAVPAKAAHDRKAASSHASDRPHGRGAHDARDGRGERRHEVDAPKTARKPASRSARSKTPGPLAPKPRPRTPRGEAGDRGNGVGDRRNTDVSATPRTPAPEPPGASAVPDTSVVPDNPGDRLSAAYACRHLQQSDWRYDYCVRVWNDYKKRNGLP
ncbi:hypothetical protein ACQPYK_24920 [Streptosporangium sp. CA-135522]|uniref:hypothetical protein n=1 Tax=Streptosporangium sp. CA-135522 TaxID=3240072 RepID=UPI003D8EE30A